MKRSTTLLRLGLLACLCAVSALSVAQNQNIEVRGDNRIIDNNDNTPSTEDGTEFGTAYLNSITEREFKIMNTHHGGNPNQNKLIISDITITGPHASDFSFEHIDFPLEIKRSKSEWLDVTFSPTHFGLRTAVITIYNNSTNQSEQPYTFTIQGTGKNVFFDSDNDGVYDDVDKDDDNDGISDEEEELYSSDSPYMPRVNYKLLQESFGTGNRSELPDNISESTLYCYEDGTSSSNTLSCENLSSADLDAGEYAVLSAAGSNAVANWASTYWYQGGDHTGDDNGRMAVFNASETPGTFYIATANGFFANIPMHFSFWIINLDRSDAPGINSRVKPNITVEFRDMQNNLLHSFETGAIMPTSASNPNGDWYEISTERVLGVTDFKVMLKTNQNGSDGNDFAIDDITIKQTLKDFDGDGVANSFDLDSDNDGIPDIVESGNAQYSFGKGKVDLPWTDANGDGMHDQLSASQLIDTDGDGAPDFTDLDSDNDAIFDVDESGAIYSLATNFQNGDGDIDGDGMGDLADTEAFREFDYNNDGVSELLGDGIIDLFDYHNGNGFSNGYGNNQQGGGQNPLYTLDFDNSIPDFVDVKSNGVTYDIAKTLFRELDTDNDGVINDSADTDGDGLLDIFDTDDTRIGSPRDLQGKFQLYFDGRNDYGEEPSIMSGWNQSTIMAWIKIDPTGSGGQFILGEDDFYINLKSGGQVEAVGKGQKVSSGSALAEDQWVHVAATYKASDAVKLYVNGVLQGQKNAGGIHFG